MLIVHSKQRLHGLGSWHMRSHRLSDADEFLEAGAVGHVAGKGANNWASMLTRVSVLTGDKGACRVYFW